MLGPQWTEITVHPNRVLELWGELGGAWALLLEGATVIMVAYVGCLVLHRRCCGGGGLAVDETPSQD